jgi:hypothetical protein
MRAAVVAMVLLAAPASAQAPPQIVVAPAGECAGEELDLAQGVFPLAPAPSEAPPEFTLAHLTPANVAANGSVAGAPPPTAPEFLGPGSCDNPGSGCLGEKLVEDPDPGTGCGFPGSPCP